MNCPPIRLVAFTILLAGIARSLRGEILELARTIPLPNVTGRIDHFSIDAMHARLFVAALGNNTIEVVDLKAGKVMHSLGGFSEPQDILYLPEYNRLYVTNGSDGTLRVFEGTTFAQIAMLEFQDDADNLRYDEKTKQIYVGYGRGALGIVDAEKNVVVGSLALSAHPESFQLENNGPRIFVNLPGSHKISIQNRVTKISTGSWSLGLVAANFPMALDESDHRAFIGCRLPSRLLVFDTESGQEIAKLNLHGDCDDIFYDPDRHLIYASCGEGFVDVFEQKDPDHYRALDAVKSAKKARTAFFTGKELYVAAPRDGDVPARILCYAINTTTGAP